MKRSATETEPGRVGPRRAAARVSRKADGHPAPRRPRETRPAVASGRHGPALLAALLWTAAARAADPAALNAGTAILSFPGGHGLALTGGYATATPAVVVTANGATASAAYDRVGSGDGQAVGTADVSTPNGSRFHFVDRWIVTHAGDFALSRTVTVTAADPRDGGGFDTRLALSVPGVKTVADAELFLPGVWYRHNDHVVPHAIGADKSLGTYLVKETCLALPMVTARANGAGPAVTIIHANAHPATGLRDADPGPQTDASIRYGSLGYDADAVTFCYPGTEGTVSYNARGPRRRYHPIRPGVDHGYDLVVRLTPPGDFAAVMTDAWRHAMTAYAPVVHPAPSGALYQAGVAVFERYYRDDFPGGGRGLPFMVWLGLHAPRGRDRNPGNPASGKGVSSYHLQSGFVGLQTSADALMLRRALLAGDAKGVARWSAAVDFWAERSWSDAGVPRTDYDAEHGRWMAGPSFLRTLSDGAEGVVDADHLRPTRRWRAFAVRVGDWLLHGQQPDGSWARSYNPDGTVANPGAFNTSNPIRFLCKLAADTGDMKYHGAAVRAGQWCLDHVDAPGAYVGGTSDNDNTTDKEGGVMAMNGFAALYDATGDRRFLSAAARAADFAETWVYGWSYDVRPARGAVPGVRSPWPACGLLGQSLVATGHSYVDMYMVGCSTAYYRLALQTGDAHYRDVARLLADGANRPADTTGALGYPDRGLIEEGVSPADFVANGPGVCLTWCTVSQVRPVAEMQDLFGCDTVDEAEAKLTADQRRARNRAWFAPH